jgi:hypothetical protein
LNKGDSPDQIRLPFDAQSNKQNLSMAWSFAQGELTQEGVQHCWESCCDGTLLDAWSLPCQREAVSQQDILFPNLGSAPLSLHPPEYQGVLEVNVVGVGIADDTEGENPDDFIDSILVDF